MFSQFLKVCLKSTLVLLMHFPHDQNICLVFNDLVPWHYRMYCLMLYDVLEARCCCLPIATAWHYCTISRTVSYIHFYMVIFIKHYIFTFDNKTKGLLVLSAPSDILTCRDLFYGCHFQLFYFQLHFLFAFCCLFGLRSFDPENGYQCDITT